MRRLILAAAGLALLVPAALAQTAPAPVGSPAAGQPAPAGQPGGPGAMAGPGGPAVQPPGGPGTAPPPPPPGGPRGPGMVPPPPPPPPSPAAHIHLQRGDAVVDVKCNDGDSTKACADIADAMLDRLANQPAATRN